jgi:hypothetical protein
MPIRQVTLDGSCQDFGSRYFCTSGEAHGMVAKAMGCGGMTWIPGTNTDWFAQVACFCIQRRKAGIISPSSLFAEYWYICWAKGDTLQNLEIELQKR